MSPANCYFTLVIPQRYLVRTARVGLIVISGLHQETVLLASALPTFLGDAELPAYANIFLENKIFPNKFCTYLDHLFLSLRISTRYIVSVSYTAAFNYSNEMIKLQSIRFLQLVFWVD